MNEIVFIATEAPEGGYTARALGHSIFTESDTFEGLQDMIRDAVRCHFGEEKIAMPKAIRILFTKEEVIAA